MNDRVSLQALIVVWVYGLICGLGIASTVVGVLRGEAMPGVIWPALTPLMLAPLLILRLMGSRQGSSSAPK